MIYVAQIIKGDINTFLDFSYFPTSYSIYMALPLDEELLADMSVQILQYKLICDYFGFSEKQRRSSSAADWIIQAVKQYQTSYNVMKSIHMNAGNKETLAGETKVTLPPLPLSDKGGEI